MKRLTYHTTSIIQGFLTLELRSIKHVIGQNNTNLKYWVLGEDLFQKGKTEEEYYTMISYMYETGLFQTTEVVDFCRCQVLEIQSIGFKINQTE